MTTSLQQVRDLINNQSIQNTSGDVGQSSLMTHIQNNALLELVDLLTSLTNRVAVLEAWRAQLPPGLR